MANETTRSLSRAISILKVVARAQSTGLRLATITKETNISKTTTIRLIQTLLEERMLIRTAEKKYLLGPESLALGAGTDDHNKMVKLSNGPVRRIAIACGDSAFLLVRSGFHSICLVREDGAYPLKTHVLQPGTKLPLGVGAGGTAMLAAMSDQDIERCIATNQAYCERHYPGNTPQQMLDRVQECREKGYAINKGSVANESWGLAAMVRDKAGSPVAALVIAAVQSRLQPDREAKLGPLLMKEAASLERFMHTTANE